MAVANLAFEADQVEVTSPSPTGERAEVRGRLAHDPMRAAVVAERLAVVEAKRLPASSPGPLRIPLRVQHASSRTWGARLEAWARSFSVWL